MLGHCLGCPNQVTTAHHDEDQSASPHDDEVLAIDAQDQFARHGCRENAMDSSPNSKQQYIKFFTNQVREMAMKLTSTNHGMCGEAGITKADLPLKMSGESGEIRWRFDPQKKKNCRINIKIKKKKKKKLKKKKKKKNVLMMMRNLMTMKRKEEDEESDEAVEDEEELCNMRKVEKYMSMLNAADGCDNDADADGDGHGNGDGQQQQHQIYNRLRIVPACGWNLGNMAGISGGNLQQQHRQNIPEGKEEECWVAQVEPGVSITFLALPDGSNSLKRIRFCQEMFMSKWEAQRWWAENSEMVCELYSVASKDVEHEHLQPSPSPPSSSPSLPPSSSSALSNHALWNATEAASVDDKGSPMRHSDPADGSNLMPEMMIHAESMRVMCNRSTGEAADAEDDSLFPAGAAHHRRRRHHHHRNGSSTASTEPFLWGSSTLTVENVSMGFNSVYVNLQLHDDDDEEEEEDGEEECKHVNACADEVVLIGES